MKATCSKGHAIKCIVCARLEKYRSDPEYRKAELSKMALRYQKRKARRAALTPSLTK